VIAAALILAHAGHWFAGLLYLAPVLIVVGALLYQSWKDKREGGDEDDEPGAEPGHVDVS
jgi:4-hydroxybenzoate polyprenyltransferase